MPIRTRLPRPSAAMVVATAALVAAAAGGGAIAASSINGSEIKNGTIAGAKLKNGAVSASKIGANAVGATQIASGAIQQTVQTTSGTIGAGENGWAQVNCPSGATAVSGGYSGVPDTVGNVGMQSVVLSSYPTTGAAGAVTPGQQSTGWFVQVANRSGQPMTLGVYAVCQTA